MMVQKKSTRGILLTTALVITFIMSLWIVAALARAKYQAGVGRKSAAKNEAYYLAKTSTSRSLSYLNANPGWANIHNSEAAAYDTTPGARTWVETVTGGSILHCVATVNGETSRLKVPLRKLSDENTQVLSSSPSVGAGPDLIAWTTSRTVGWKTLPALPLPDKILSSTGTSRGDIFAISENGLGETDLWRYRPGRGWTKMPPLPSNDRLRKITIANSERIVGLGSNNTILILDLDQDLRWESVSPPPGVTLTEAAVPVTDKSFIYTTSESGSSQGIRFLNVETQAWSSLPVPTAATFDTTSGQLVGYSGQATDLSGGIGVDANGHVFVGSNPTDELSVIYEFVADGIGSNTGTWRPFPALPQFQNQSDGTVSSANFITNILDLCVDDEGVVWAQWQDDSGNFGNLKFNPNAE